ncbi:MAG: hypothetical protein JJ896_05390 [Rhodothermales bacterium]|nr:hypothetical protein [Rhodothermales bacterium]MBO6779068.1 hypothetical protein [Rhodothermales bacterium]
MKKYFYTLATVAALLAAAPVSAQTANQTVTVVVSDINSISVSSGSVTLTVNSATAGSNPDDATDSSTSYSITTNGSAKKITAALGSAYATGISLAINLTAPSGGTSAGSTTLTTSAQEVVTGISNLAESGIGISYTASATPSATSNGAGEAQTVTLTITS